MKIYWLGQAGVMFKLPEITIMVDPYLSNSAAKINPKSYRRCPVDERIFDIVPDIMIFTHSHIDHYDPETVEKFLDRQKRITVLAPSSVWSEVRKSGGVHNYVEFNAGTEWSEPGVRLIAVPAAHSDHCAIGVAISVGEKVYYVTGDTLYNREVIKNAPRKADAVFLPINGKGNNMNMIDAARFAEEIEAKQVVPMHFGMFDEIDPTEFKCPNAIIPRIFEEVELR